MRDDSLLSIARPSPHRDELVVLAAPTQAWSADDGTMTSCDSHGVFHGDWRYVRTIEVLVDGLPLEHISTTEERDWIVFRGIPLDPETGGPIHRASVERMREISAGGMVERVTLINDRDEPIDALVELVCEIELAPLSTVRAGTPEPVAHSLELEGNEAIATDGTRTLRASSSGGHVRTEGCRVIVSQQVHVLPDDWAGITLELDIVDPSLAVHGTDRDESWRDLPPTGRAALDRWAARSLDDLGLLLLDAGHGAFPAAGAPWHMTLVARDALIACRLALPMGGQLAEGTLRTLAARQGVQFDSATGEEPGRILHAVRPRTTHALLPGVEAPPVYDGSVDPTPLWIVLLHDAWQAGLPLETVRELRTALHTSLRWLRSHTGEGFFHCPDGPGTGYTAGGLRAQPDGVRFGADDTDIVTSQAQGLACRAAVSGATLLDALGDDGEPWREWAQRLRERFRESFWVEHRGDRFPAMALDVDGHPREELVSDIGQLIGTTLLSRAEEAAVARLLLEPRLSSGFGLRTMSTDAEHSWPLAHDGGAIWPHDTAIAIEGLLRSGFLDEARELAEQLERAADAFGGRMPEVYAGYGLEETSAPIPYPGARGLHAASAASVVPAHRALTTVADAQSPSARPVPIVPRAEPSVPDPGTPEPMLINSSSIPHSRAHLHLVPSAPAP